MIIRSCYVYYVRYKAEFTCYKEVFDAYYLYSDEAKVGRQLCELVVVGGTWPSWLGVIFQPKRFAPHQVMSLFTIRKPTKNQAPSKPQSKQP